MNTNNPAQEPEQFQQWKTEARKLSIADLKRHASVSVRNNHYCHECFCCAALDVLKERRRT
jgi:hypothetical protein